MAELPVHRPSMAASGAGVDEAPPGLMRLRSRSVTPPPTEHLDGAHADGAPGAGPALARNRSRSASPPASSSERAEAAVRRNRGKERLGWIEKLISVVLDPLDTNADGAFARRPLLRHHRLLDLMLVSRWAQQTVAFAFRWANAMRSLLPLDRDRSECPDSCAQCSVWAALWCRAGSAR